jgi:hypothetical protein
MDDTMMCSRKARIYKKAAFEARYVPVLLPAQHWKGFFVQYGTNY